MLFLLVLMAQVHGPSVFTVTDQHGDQVEIRCLVDQTFYVVFGDEAQSVRKIASWLKQKSPAEISTKCVFCIVDITDMPENIKTRRFLPRIKASAHRVGLIDKDDRLQWIPRQKGLITLLTYDPSGEYSTTFCGDLSTLDRMLELDSQ